MHIGVVNIGRTQYSEAWKLQKSLFDLRHYGLVGDLLVLTEHEHVYTLGKGADGNHLLASDEELRKDESAQMGPVVSKRHMERVLGHIEKGVQEGATLLLDGRNVKVPGYEKGFPNCIPYIILPNLITIFVALGYNTRFFRSVAVEEMSRDYVRTAKAYGAGTRKRST